jgi:hypothetical protein
VLILVNVATVALLIYSTLLLVDCTTPQGECTKRQQQRTTELLHEIARHDEAVAYCANKPENNTLVKIQECTKREKAKVK